MFLVLKELAERLIFQDDGTGSAFLKQILQDCDHPEKGYATIAHGTIILEELRPIFEQNDWISEYDIIKPYTRSRDHC